MSGYDVVNAADMLTCGRLEKSLLWLGVCLAILFVMCLLYKFIPLKSKACLWTMIDHMLMPVFIVLWMMGFVVYAMGGWIPAADDRGDFWAIVPSAIVDATKMFVFASDLPSIHNSLKGNALFMGVFYTLHLTAALFSLIFVIRHFGFYLMEKLHVWLAGVLSAVDVWPFKRGKRQLYVIYGTDDCSLCMAESISRSDPQGDIVVIQSVSDDDTQGSMVGISRIMGRAKMQRSITDSLRGRGYLIMFTRQSMAAGGFTDHTKVIRDTLGLVSLDRLIRHAGDKKYFFFLGGDEKENITAAVNIEKDLSLQQSSEGQETYIYCRAHYNDVSRVVEDETTHKHIIVKVIDPAEISVDMLKQDAGAHPVNFVSVEPGATVSLPFHALVVGMGGTGMAALKFLYEFGTFMASGCTEDDIHRSPFHCDVVDTDVNGVEGQLKEQMPAVDISRSEQSMVTLHGTDCRSGEFSEALGRWIETLNYVVLATDNDEENLHTAVRILRMAMRRRMQPGYLRIAIRVRHDADGHIHAAIRHYNILVEAERQTAGGGIHQLSVRRDTEVTQPVMVLFGEEERIFTYDYVVKEQLLCVAKLYKRKYDESVNAWRIQQGEKPQPVQTWDEERKELMQTEGRYEGFAPTYTAIMRLRRVQTQNLQNGFHLLTKRIIAKRTLGEELYARLLASPPHRIMGTVEYEASADKRITKILHVLARMEHLRWQASHEVLGYVCHGDVYHKNETRMQHGCMRQWHELPINIQSYDYNVVDVAMEYKE